MTTTTTITSNATTKVTTYRVHLKVDELSTSQRYDNLTHVHSASVDCLLAWSLPLVHSLVRSDVPDTIWINLPPQPQHCQVKVNRSSAIKPIQWS